MILNNEININVESNLINKNNFKNNFYIKILIYCTINYNFIKKFI